MAPARVAALAFAAAVASLVVLACSDDSDGPLPATAFLTALEEAGHDFAPTGDPVVICARYPRTAGVIYRIDGHEFVLFEFPSAAERGYEPADDRGNPLPGDTAAQGGAFHGCRWDIEHVFWNRNLMLTTESPGGRSETFDPASDTVVASVIRVFTNARP